MKVGINFCFQRLAKRMVTVYENIYSIYHADIQSKLRRKSINSIEFRIIKLVCIGKREFMKQMFISHYWFDTSMEARKWQMKNKYYDFGSNFRINSRTLLLFSRNMTQWSISLNCDAKWSSSIKGCCTYEIKVRQKWKKNYKKEPKRIAPNRTSSHRLSQRTQNKKKKGFSFLILPIWESRLVALGR